MVERWQDIQIPDVDLWKQLRSLWNGGNIQQAIDILQNASVGYKWINANGINAITTETVRLQEQEDPTFKDKKIETLVGFPENPYSDQIIFSQES